MGFGGSRCGLDRHQRERFLREHGFVKTDRGKGSHTMWEHPELKNLARFRKVSAPANLLANVAQKPWELNLAADPAKGTWHEVSKLAMWCQKEAQGAAIDPFRLTQRDICDWKNQPSPRSVARPSEQQAHISPR